MKLSKNVFIAVEGVDGSGKSTIVRYLSRELRNTLIYSCPPMQLLPLREIMNGASPQLRYEYFNLGNYVGGKEIEASLPHQQVICLRYVHSTAAYHSVLMDRELEVPKDIFKPDFIIHTNAPIGVIDERLSKREHRTPYEGRDFLMKVQAEYDRLFHGMHNVIGVNTAKSTPSHHAKRIIKAIQDNI